MKRYLLVHILIYSFVVSVLAQTQSYYKPFALPEPPDSLVSPLILPDNRVVFRLYAPQALGVQINSDCFGHDIDRSAFGTSRGKVSMSKDSTGIWSYTTQFPIYPNCYTYEYIVDLINIVVDPANPNEGWNQGSHFSIFAVGGDSIADFFVDSNVQHGSLREYTYYSNGMQQERRISVYLPPEFDSIAHTYPILYLLHGISGDETAWLTLGRAAQVLDNMIAHKMIDPMIVVMPNCNAVITSKDDGATTLTDNILNIPKQLSGVFENSFGELIEFIEQRFPISDNSMNHAIAGLSSGGYQAANIVKLMPDYFGTIGLFSATLWKNQVPTDDSFSQLIKYYLYVGTNDWVSWSLSTHSAMRIQNKGYNVELIETVGGHSWKWWRHYLVSFLTQFANRQAGR